MSKLFSAVKLKEIEFKNRIFVSPMCQYCSIEGMPTEWHFVHLGSRAVGGAALVFAEAAAVSPEGRITPWDNGMWSDEHAQAFKPIAAFIKAQGAIPGIQINHTGRKASTDAPWRNRRPLSESEGGWKPLAPSAIPEDRSSPVPREMTHAEIAEMVSKFSAAARRCHQAGFEVFSCTWRTATCAISSSPPFQTNVGTSMEEIWRIAPGSRWKLPKPSEKSGQATCPFSSGFLALTGCREDGICLNPSSCAAGSRKWALI